MKHEAENGKTENEKRSRGFSGGWVLLVLGLSSFRF